MLKQLLAKRDALARIAAHRARLGFVNGIQWLTRDPQDIVGQTPFDVVEQREKLVVRRYRPAQRRHHYPLLLVPPLMVKPFVFDLQPQRSMVAHLCSRGYLVYLVDFGEPDRADAYITLDHYVLDWLPLAARVAREDASSEGLSLVGYCMGGLFALCHAAANRDEAVRNIVTIGSPVDMHKMGLLAWVAKHGGRQAERMTRRLGNVPGGVSSTAFRLLAPMKNLTRYADLFMNMWNEEYVNGFDAMNQWTAQFVDYPQEAFVQFLRDFVRKNKLVKGKLSFGDKVADLKAIEASLLAFAGQSDRVVPIRAARSIVDAVGSTDTDFRVVPGGHMGVFAGASAPEHVWEPIACWLAERSGDADAPHTGD